MMRKRMVRSAAGVFLLSLSATALDEQSQSGHGHEGASQVASSKNDRIDLHRTPADIWNDFLQDGRDARYYREPVLVDYKGKHPYEQSNSKHGSAEEEDRRRAQNTPITSDESSTFQPMRIHFDTHLLDALITEYPEHISYIRNNLVPSLVDFWSRALTVVPAQKIEVPLAGGCAAYIKQLSGYTLNDYMNSTEVKNNVELNSNGNSMVYNNADLVVAIIPMEGTELCPNSQNIDSSTATLAFATNCQNDQMDRPTVGFTGICFGPLDIEADNTTKRYEMQMMTIFHEFTHVLGFNSVDFPYYYNHATGKPRTPRNVFNMPSQKEVLCVDGTRQSVSMPSESTVKPVTTPNGYIAYEIVTETVRNVARNQFNCQTLEGARLENQPTTTEDCFGSHWDHRLFNNEYMAAVSTGSSQYVTALTLALLEDSGWYKSNYEMTRNSPFGLGAGCEFVEETCIQDGELPSWAQGTFCSSPSSIGCTADRHLVAYCDISQWGGNLPEGYQYFEDPSIGGGLQQMDFCPAYTTIFRFEANPAGDDVQVLDCTDPNLTGSWVQKIPEVFGVTSRCIEHASGDRPLCLEVICGKDGKDAGKVILLPEGGDRLTCSNAGEILRLPGGTDIICPSFEQVCPDSMCPGNCSGRGVCNYSQFPPQCECFDENDSSPICAESPLSLAPVPTASPAPTAKVEIVESSALPTTSPTSKSTTMITTSPIEMETMTPPTQTPIASQYSKLPTIAPMTESLPPATIAEPTETTAETPSTVVPTEQPNVLVPPTAAPSPPVTSRAASNQPCLVIVGFLLLLL